MALLMLLVGDVNRGVAHAFAIAMVLGGPGVGSAGDYDDVRLPRLDLTIIHQGPHQVGSPDHYYDVPLPRDRIQVTPPDPSIPAEVAAFSGRWYGKWRPGPYCILIVRKIDSRDAKGRFAVEAFYSAGSINILAQWVAQPGFIEPSGGVAKGTLVLEDGSRTIAFRFLEGGTELEGRHEASARDIQRYGLFTREPRVID